MATKFSYHPIRRVVRVLERLPQGRERVELSCGHIGVFYQHGRAMRHCPECTPEAKKQRSPNFGPLAGSNKPVRME